MIGWSIGVAWAQEAPPPEPEPAPVAAPAPAPPADAATEIVVYGELRVEQARQQVIVTLEDLGYASSVRDRGNYTVYRHEDPYMGEVLVHDDGWIRVKRQPLRVEGRQMPWAKRDTPVAWAGCLIWPWLCLRVDGALLSHRKWLGVSSRTVEVLDPKTRTWGDRVADLAVDRKIDTLPSVLDALWNEGVPLDGSEVRLVTWDEKKQAVLRYWVTRTDTAWGDALRRAVESWVRAVVQTSDHPFTDEEIAAFDREHPDRPFDLSRPPDPGDW